MLAALVAIEQLLARQLRGAAPPADEGEDEAGARSVLTERLGS